MSKLTDALSEAADPTLAALDTTRPADSVSPANANPAVVTVYVVNGTRTSQGPGPGVKQLPPLEANALIRQRFAVPGDRAPNEPDPAPTVKAFTGVHDPFPPRAGTRHGISN